MVEGRSKYNAVLMWLEQSPFYLILLRERKISLPKLTLQHTLHSLSTAMMIRRDYLWWNVDSLPLILPEHHLLSLDLDNLETEIHVRTTI